LQLLEGRAFLDYLDERDAAGRELQWHVAFGAQRFRGRVVPATVDPRFDDTFFLALPASSRAGLLEAGGHMPMRLTLSCRGAPGRRGGDPEAVPRPRNPFKGLNMALN